MADGHTDTSSASNVSDSSSNFHYEGNSFDFEQYLSYNANKKRFSWNGTLEELESFVDTKLSRLIDDGDNGLKTKKSYNSSGAILKLPNVTLNFYRNTKTLQVQGKAAEDVRDILNELIQNNLLVADLTEDTAEHSIASGMINEEHTSSVNNTLIADQNDSQTVKNEIDKLWKAIDAIKQKFEFPANLSQVDALQRKIDEYKFKCAEYEVKIQELQQEKASLMESIKILSSDLLVSSHDPQPASDDWQTVTSNKSNNPKRGKKKKKGKASSQNQQLQMENNDTSENGQGEQRPNEGTIIVGDSIVKGLRRDLLSRAAKQRVTVRSFPGATTADMEHYLQPSLAKKPKAIILHVGTNDLKTSSSARNVAEKIVDLGNIIATNSPNTSVTISAITQRSDEESLKIKVKDCNKVLRTFCNQNGWGFVEHLNIDETCLNNYKLHLNKKGIAILASNFVNNIVH